MKRGYWISLFLLVAIVLGVVALRGNWLLVALRNPPPSPRSWSHSFSSAEAMRLGFLANRYRDATEAEGPKGKRLIVTDSWSEEVFVKERAERASSILKFPVEYLLIRLELASFDDRDFGVQPQVECEPGRWKAGWFYYFWSEGEIMYQITFYEPVPKSVVLHWPFPDGVYTMRLEAVDGE